MATQLQSVPPRSLTVALDYIRNGGRLVVPTYTRITVLDRKCLARWDRAGEWLLKEDGDGYRMRTGRSSVYLLPGQLKFA
jgi:hypothetical protein